MCLFLLISVEMPAEPTKIGGSPLPSVTPPRLQSPSKARLQSRGDSRNAETTPTSPQVPTPDAPRDVDKDPVSNSLIVNKTILKIKRTHFSFVLWSYNTNNQIHLKCYYFHN